MPSSSSLLARALLPIAMLVACVTLAAVLATSLHGEDKARADLQDKANLIASVLSEVVVDTVWNYDPEGARALLASSKTDPDYVSGIVLDDHGKPFASFEGAQAEAIQLVTVERPITRYAGVVQQSLGALRITVSRARADVAAARQRWMLAGVGAALLVGVCGGLFLILRSITRPIVAMTRSMTALSTGDLDAPIPALGRRDELGAMARAVQVFKENAAAVQRLTAEREDQKHQSALGRRSLLDRMAGEFEAGIAELLTGVSAAAASSHDTAAEMARRMMEAERSAALVTSVTDQMAASVGTAATATEELSASIGGIARRVAESADHAGTAAEAAQSASGTIEALAEQTRRITSVVKLIRSIAERTNLLSLNAAIEAHRAGDAGRGFAVVATEVKELAAQTAAATRQIAGQIASIQGASEHAVRDVNCILDTARQSRAIAIEIAATIDQQSAATREIAENVTRAAGGTRSVAQNIALVSASLGQTSQSAQVVVSASSDVVERFRSLQGSARDFVAGVQAA